jgi:hypothetical protein
LANENAWFYITLTSHYPRVYPPIS